MPIIEALDDVFPLPVDCDHCVKHSDGSWCCGGDDEDHRRLEPGECPCGCGGGHT